MFETGSSYACGQMQWSEVMHGHDVRIRFLVQKIARNFRAAIYGPISLANVKYADAPPGMLPSLPSGLAFASERRAGLSPRRK